MQRILYTLAFSLLISFGLYSQSRHESYNKAIQLQAEGQYEPALRLFERVYYFSKDSLRKPCLIHLGECNNALGQFGPAVDNYQNAILLAGSAKEKNNIKLLEIKSLILANQDYLVPGVLKDLDTLQFRELIRPYNFYTGVYHYLEGNFDSSFRAFNKLAAGDSLKTAKLAKIFRQNRKIDRIRPGLALTMSLLLPGSGQVYAGYYKEGINSILLNGAFATITVLTYNAYGLFDAMVAPFPWFFRYYIGGATKARRLAIQRIIVNRDKVYRELLGLFSE